MQHRKTNRDVRPTDRMLIRLSAKELQQLRDAPYEKASSMVGASRDERRTVARLVSLGLMEWGETMVRCTSEGEIQSRPLSLSEVKKKKEEIKEVVGRATRTSLELALYARLAAEIGAIDRFDAVELIRIGRLLSEHIS